MPATERGPRAHRTGPSSFRRARTVGRWLAPRFLIGALAGAGLVPVGLYAVPLAAAVVVAGALVIAHGR